MAENTKHMRIDPPSNLAIARASLEKSKGWLDRYRQRPLTETDPYTADLVSAAAHLSDAVDAVLAELTIQEQRNRRFLEQH